MSEKRLKAQPLSRGSIRQCAKEFREKLGLKDAEYIDVIWLVEYVCPKLFKNYDFEMEIMSKDEMGNYHGLTDPESGHIYIREDVYDGACMGHGRDRFTIAHELGHFLLHDGITLGLAKVADDETIPVYCDPEWQANAFAGELLMDHDVIANMTVSEIAVKCGVSYDAAAYQKKKNK